MLNRFVNRRTLLLMMLAIGLMQMAGHYLAGALVFVLMDVTLFEKVEWLRNLA